jgi:hypothetical protein
MRRTPFPNCEAKRRWVFVVLAWGTSGELSDAATTFSLFQYFFWFFFVFPRFSQVFRFSQSRAQFAAFLTGAESRLGLGTVKTQDSDDSALCASCAADARNAQRVVFAGIRRIAQLGVVGHAPRTSSARSRGTPRRKQDTLGFHLRRSQREWPDYKPYVCPSFPRSARPTSFGCG